MTSLLNFIKIYQLVQKLLEGDRQTDRQTGDLISLTFLFEENRLKTSAIETSALKNPRANHIIKSPAVGPCGSTPPVPNTPLGLDLGQIYSSPHSDDLFIVHFNIIVEFYFHRSVETKLKEFRPSRTDSTDQTFLRSWSKYSPSFMEPDVFFTVFTTAHHWFLS
jgi:hypothetical protein